MRRIPGPMRNGTARNNGFNAEARRDSRQCRYRSTVRRRCGWTLVEMVVTITIMSVLTGIAIKTLTTLLLSERTGVQHVVDLATVSRLARQFRQDVHSAKSVEVNSATASKPLLQVTIAEGHQIDYQVQDAGLLRRELRPDKSVHNELWRLKKTQFECQTNSGTPQIVTLVLKGSDRVRNAGKTNSTLKVMQIDAIAGRDRESSQ